jgi:hypothetical protein
MVSRRVSSGRCFMLFLDATKFMGVVLDILFLMCGDSFANHWFWLGVSRMIMLNVSLDSLARRPKGNFLVSSTSCLLDWECCLLLWSYFPDLCDDWFEGVCVCGSDESGCLGFPNILPSVTRICICSSMALRFDMCVCHMS